MVHSFRANRTGRDFVVGDIHGQFDTLRMLMSQVEFDTDNDRLFAVGDLIDRGAQSEQVVDWLAMSWFHSVRGNHEQMVIDCMVDGGDVQRHMRNGGEWFYKLPASTQVKILTVLQGLPVAIELELPNGEQVGIVHAEVDDDWREGVAALTRLRGKVAFMDAKKTALYSRVKFETQKQTIVKGMHKVFVGHTTVKHVTEMGNTIYMDTGCSFSDGMLSMVELCSGVVATCT
ncbi:metallophosphoesterase [Pseudomonas sp. 14P_8.1_Bac3]|uniref:metallophosphoesterase n=1 Tax=Pseudomonas sp. 14P_8.1_Bac3 TaxID=2971621 RepID=UPI0021C646FA|nr:metallophosphoesterase [Pseudomonas sp. 14P_8.1_Bac3]MCU1762147.1 metallophosphoesterase [Pseudomonas sp. 14P_8.1_Bac3]